MKVFRIISDRVKKCIRAKNVINNRIETEHVIFYPELPEDFACEQLLPADLQIVDSFIECTRHIDEIHQLSSLFRFNLNLLLSNFTLLPSGTVLKNKKPAVSFNDYTAVNAMVISIISAGTTLIDSLECYIKEHCPRQTHNSFKTATGNCFDTVFEYKLLSQLRNYSQHGHVPLGIQEGKYCFDLYQISNTPHLKLNAVAKKDFISHSKSIMEKYKDTPTLSLTLTLAKYVEQISKLELLYYNLIENQFFSLHTDFFYVINKHPNNILADGTNYSFIYENNDGKHHAAIAYNLSAQMFKNYKAEASIASCKDKENVDTLFEGIKIVYS